MAIGNMESGYTAFPAGKLKPSETYRQATVHEFAVE